MVRSRGLLVLLSAALVAFACGPSSPGGGSKGTIKIGSDLPVCTVGGQSTANGVQFAVTQKNNAGGVNGSENSPALNEICRYTIFGGRSIALTV